MGLPQTNSAFKQVFDTLTIPYQKPDMVLKAIAKASPVLNKLISINSGGNKPFSGIKTFEGRDVKVPINALYPVTYANRGKFNIQIGDVKQPENSKNVIYATINAVDKGWTMGITEYDRQLLKNKGVYALINWIEQYWKDTMYGFGISLVDSIYNGLGDSATDNNGLTKPDFIGAFTAAGTGTYGGKTSSDWYEWQGQAFDASAGSGSLFGLDLSTLTTTIANWLDTTKSVGTLNTPFYHLVQSAVEKVKQFSKSKNLCVIMHPAIYNYLWLPSLETNIKNMKVINNNPTALAEIDREATYLAGGVPVYKEDTSLPTDQLGSAPTYIFPSNKILILDMDSLSLEAESSNNFKFSEWDYIQTQYLALQKSMTSTMLYYFSHRFSNAIVTLNSTLVSNCTTAYGI